EFPYSGNLVSLESKRWSQLSTPDHRMVWQDRHNQIRKSTVDGLPARFGLPLAGQRKRTTGQLDEWLLRTMVMVQADGHYTADGDLKLKFAKQRKVERCKTLLRRAGISYYCRVGDNGDRKDYYHLFTIQSRHLPLALRMFRNKEFGWWLLDEDPGVFFSELPNWDGTRYSDNSVQYCTTSKINADIIQAFAHLSMIVASRSVKPATGGNSEAHYLQLWSGAGPFTVSRGNSQRVPFEGKVYCAETSSGYFLVRRNGKVWVTGNSSRGVQIQNLPRAELPQTEEHILDVLLGNNPGPEVLKGLVRALFVGPFTVVDYSAIEARGLAWAAGEEWVLEAFRNKRDVYVETANRMSTPDNPMTRQHGKVAVLALGYQGGKDALRNMGATGTDEELTVLRDLYREANPRIKRLWFSMERAFVEGGTAGRLRVDKANRGKDRHLVLPSGRSLIY
ncbi:MAG TPA: hypothetical protein VK054_01845, partial [Beutenbergiaceae bacterium]|nr:hypothetical protein [Beutenbergiaceae bacterium]